MGKSASLEGLRRVAPGGVEGLRLQVVSRTGLEPSQPEGPWPLKSCGCGCVTQVDIRATQGSDPNEGKEAVPIAGLTILALETTTNLAMPVWHATIGPITRTPSRKFHQRAAIRAASASARA